MKKLFLGTGLALTLGFVAAQDTQAQEVAIDFEGDNSVTYDELIETMIETGNQQMELFVNALTQEILKANIELDEEWVASEIAIVEAELNELGLEDAQLEAELERLNEQVPDYIRTLQGLELITDVSEEDVQAEFEQTKDRIVLVEMMYYGEEVVSDGTKELFNAVASEIEGMNMDEVREYLASQEQSETIYMDVYELPKNELVYGSEVNEQLEEAGDSATFEEGEGTMYAHLYVVDTGEMDYEESRTQLIGQLYQQEAGTSPEILEALIEHFDVTLSEGIQAILDEAKAEREAQAEAEHQQMLEDIEKAMQEQEEREAELDEEGTDEEGSDEEDSDEEDSDE